MTCPHLSAPVHPERPYFTQQGLSLFLGKSERTLRRWRQRGVGPAYVRTGPGQFGYRVSDVEAWMLMREEEDDL